MGYGQYSAGGGMNRTKGDMMGTAFAAVGTANLVKSRKGGKNRLWFQDDEGREYFILHETVVATFDRLKMLLTLADGGWHTPTTKSAWGDACAAFGFRYFYESDFGPVDKKTGRKGRWYPSTPALPGRDERSVTYQVIQCGHEVVFHRTNDVTADVPMLRADTDDGNFAVRYDGKHLFSGAGTDIKVSPFHVLKTLYRVDGLCKAVGSRHAMRGCAIDGIYFEAFGFSIQCGQSARQIMVGCHTFRTMDMRAFRKAIEVRYPDAATAAKRFVRRHKLDYHLPAYEATERARMEFYRRQRAA